MQEKYILQDESNVELAKMIMIGISNNPPLASPSDNSIQNTLEFKAFNKANPNTTLEENLAYYKQCKL